MSRIGINVLYLLPGVVGGTETYAKNLLMSLCESAPEHEFYVYLNRESRDLIKSSAPNIVLRHIPVSAANRAARYFFEQTILPALLVKDRIDLIHSLGYVAPLITTCPSIVTIHDINFLRLSHDMSFARRQALRTFCVASTKTSTHVIAVSEFSKQELVLMLGVDEAKISVTYEGPGWIVKEEQQVPFANVLQKYPEIAQPYIISFGRWQPHKNVDRLIDAYKQIAEYIPHQLVLIGSYPSEIPSEWRERIVCLGYVDTPLIHPLLANAQLFVMPSLYEGFGLPILEAQAAGVAVASSDAASLPEIGGDSVAYFNPLSTEDIATQMRDVLNDPQKLMSLRDKGSVNVAQFSWKKAAQRTLDVYSNCL